MKKMGRIISECILSLFLLMTNFPSNFITTVKAASADYDASKTLVATVKMDGGELKYYYEEDSSGHTDNAAFILTEAWADASKLSYDNNKNVTFTLYHNWVADPDTREISIIILSMIVLE